MSENLQILLDCVDKFIRLDSPKDDNENLVIRIIQYYDQVKHSNVESEIVQANEALLSIGKKFSKLNDWCLDMVNGTIHKNTYSVYLIKFLAYSEKILNINKIGEENIDYIVDLLVGLTRYYDLIKQNSNQDEVKVAEKKLLSVVEKFPMLNKYFDAKIKDNSNVAELKKMILVTIEEFKEKSKGGFYSPEYCSQYMNQLEEYKLYLENLRSYFNKNEYDTLLSEIMQQIAFAQSVLSFSDFLDDDFGTRGR